MFYALLKQMPGNISKEELVWQFSGMRTESLRKMKTAEYNAMVVHMAGIVEQKPDERVVKKLRSAILKRLQKYGVDTTSWARVNKFLVDSRVAGKVLYDMSVDDMQRLIPRLEQILRKDQAQRNETNRLTLLN